MRNKNSIPHSDFIRRDFMSLNNTPSAERVHIAFFGQRNSGKSSLLNAVTNQNIAIVSDVLGTTTDPVFKAMELLPLGAVMMIDTAGIDDISTELGNMRVQKTLRILNKTDIAVLVVDSTKGLTDYENDLIEKFKNKNVPYIVAYNKCDLKKISVNADNEICVSALTGENIHELKELIAKQNGTMGDKKIVAHLLNKNDVVVLVIPIDESAPKGRLILPQVQTIRELLDNEMIPVSTRETTLKETLSALAKKPAMVITDSQAFAKVSKDTPLDIPLTSFSILMANYKSDLKTLVHGVTAIDTLKDGDKVLISEGCTHHRQCNDIGTVKLPKLLQNYTGKSLDFSWTSGTEFEEDLTKYKLVIHCGGCMLNEREMKYRLKCSVDMGVPMTNYGTAIAYMNGILQRSLAPFPDIQKFIMHNS